MFTTVYAVEKLLSVGINDRLRKAQAGQWMMLDKPFILIDGRGDGAFHLLEREVFQVERRRIVVFREKICLRGITRALR